MYVVCVAFELAEDRMNEFMSLMQRQAKNSLELEVGCHQFDVCTDADKPNQVFLYELYTDRAAFDAHLASEHFRTFDAAVSDMVAEKNVQTWTTHYSGN